MKRKILIVGGGIGGLTLAACLYKRGIEARIIEKCPEWKTIGFVLGLFPNGLSVLRYLGIHQKIIDGGKILNHYEIRNIHDHDLWGFPFEELKSDLPVIETERSNLHFTLVDATKNIDIRMNTTIIGVREEADGVTVTLSNGEIETYDTIIGADGIKSSLRKEVAPKITPTYTGMTYWLVWIPRPYGIPDEVTQFIGKKRFFSIFPSKKSEHATAAFFGMPAPAHTYDNPETAKQNIIHHFGNLNNPIIDRIIANLPTSTIDIFHADDNEIHENVWYKGKIGFLGDAVHALSPLLGMGASMAMEDAYVLADELTKEQSLEEAFKKYASRRQSRISLLERSSKFIHKVILSKGIYSLISPAILSLIVGPAYRKVIRKLIHAPY